MNLYFHYLLIVPLNQMVSSRSVYWNRTWTTAPVIRPRAASRYQPKSRIMTIAQCITLTVLIGSGRSCRTTNKTTTTVGVKRETKSADVSNKGVKRSDLTKDEKTESNTKARNEATIGNNGQRARKFVQRIGESGLKRRPIMPAALATLTTGASRRGCAANG